MGRKFECMSNSQVRRLAHQLPRPLRCTKCGKVISPSDLSICQCRAEWEMADE